mgnify:CR=1 FL=1
MRRPSKAAFFDRTPDGLLATALCEELLPIAKTVEDTVSDGQLRLTGRDALLAGKLKVSIADFKPVNQLLFRSLNEFSKAYPRIQLDVRSSNDKVDLSRREADFAIRGLKLEERPPKDIVGVKLGLLTMGLYVHKTLLVDARLGKRELSFIDSSQTAPAGLPTTADVEFFLRDNDIVDSGIHSLRALKAAQSYFNGLREESGRSLSELSRLVSLGVRRNQIPE